MLSCKHQPLKPSQGIRPSNRIFLHPLLVRFCAIFCHQHFGNLLNIACNIDIIVSYWSHTTFSPSSKFSINFGSMPKTSTHVLSGVRCVWQSNVKFVLSWTRQSNVKFVLSWTIPFRTVVLNLFAEGSRIQSYNFVREPH